MSSPLVLLLVLTRTVINITANSTKTSKKNMLTVTDTMMTGSDDVVELDIGTIVVAGKNHINNDTLDHLGNFCP